jgi:hypothetical protein
MMDVPVHSGHCRLYSAFSALAGLLVGMRVVGRRHQDARSSHHRPPVSPRRIRTNDIALTDPAGLVSPVIGLENAGAALAAVSQPAP